MKHPYGPALRVGGALALTLLLIAVAGADPAAGDGSPGKEEPVDRTEKGGAAATAEIPPIDAEAPEKTKTATFALG